ncbi:uncharacterized protein NECHADRAFT_64746 [Fusarium vanettenii 77-13-4]|uniref:NAD(P)-binding domain-containing protein n=1 Tax=Fusarium vanettenii (strain ATCC MYA-4622 / CBS 123669 / FGSC 9596 / NRRL 45880 / 77-13-4) TaxID=660122 RepID=C7Z301_FUSV7|nr:uncharacterized protein NECHADRAFT_64746 [Fusarium vanettenii 77-13-4]EEU41571.1 hypothetical protein NECHADRAFT_64746 [Fusarium vanettenii 77-13-4]
MSPRVIIFGASGAVARAAAFEAQKRGATVFLAMRDTNKAIPGLTPEIEQERGFKRVKADLSDPKSVQDAVSESGATAAFTYIVHGVQDGLRATLDAMKKAGISHVVLLSSYTLYRHPNAKAALNSSDFIPAAHAKADGFKKGEVKLLNLGAVSDYIAPEDIGSVCGVKLVEHEAESEIVPLCGPDLLTQKEAWEIVAEATGRDLTITEISEKEFIATKKENLPGIVAHALAEYFLGDDKARYPADRYKEASANIKKYTGRDPIKLSAWIKAHKEEVFGI